MKGRNWEWADGIFLGLTLTAVTILLLIALWSFPVALNWERSGTAAVCEHYWEPWRCE